MDFEELLDSTLTVAHPYIPYVVSKRYIVHARHPSGVVEAFEIKELDAVAGDSDKDGDDVTAYIRPLASDEGLETYTCLLCHENFDLHENCEQHLRHQHDAPLRCKFCYFLDRNGSKDTLLKHVEKHHPLKANKTKYTGSVKGECRRCGALCRTKSGLKEHLQKNTRCKMHYSMERQKKK